jgi:hypothetical protein
VVVIASKLDLPMQSVTITTIAVSSNHAQGLVYSIQHYVIKIISIGNYIVVQSWSLFHNFVLRWRYILSNIYKMVEPSTLFNRTNFIHMLTTVSRRLNILCNT